MKNIKKKARFFLFALAVLFFTQLACPKIALSYATNTTHPALTDQIVDFYNTSFPDQKITSKDKEQIIKGSIDEDTPPRWLNHFYDPTTNDGWLAQNLGIIPQGVLQVFTKVFLNANTEILSSKKWAHAELLQTKYSDFGGNNTWENGVRAYAEGDTDKAYYILGHILHLLEDATVPDHTRNDTHVHDASAITQDGGSPYEDFADQFSRGNLKLSPHLLKNKEQPVIFGSLDAYFDDLASYSNNYFFSEHTINSYKYSKPQILIEENGYGYANDKEGKKFPLVSVRSIFDKNTFTFAKKYSLIDNADNPLVLSAYFTRLSTAAVLDGAGVIKLFKQEGENAKKNPALLPPIPTTVKGNKMYSLGFGYILPAVTFLQNSFNSLFDTPAPLVQTENISLLSPQPVAADPYGPELPTIPKPAAPVQAPKKVIQTPAQAVLGLKIEAPIDPVIKVITPKPTLVPKSSTPDTNGGSATSAMQAENVADSVVTTTLFTTTTIDVIASSTLPASTSSVAAVPTTLTATSTSSTEPVLPIVDTSAPSIPEINVVFLKESVSPTLQVTLSSTDTGSPVILYDLSLSTTTSTEKIWQDVATSTTSTVFKLPVIRGTKYFLRARASDASGNVSEWSTVTSILIPHTQEVVINEVDWAGTNSEYSSNQWIELYNTTDNPIDLTGWKIFVSGQPMDIALKNKFIAAHDYFLLERSNDEVVRNIPADALYSLASGFNPAGNIINLVKNTGELVDQIDCAIGWFAGDAQKYRTMERLKVDQAGNDPANWQSSQGQRGIGRSYNGGDILGSPRQSNFGFLFLTGRQEEINQVLTKNNNPYILGSYEIPAGHTLTIEPGVVIKSGLAMAAFDVYGTLVSNGAAGNSVIITSGRDHDFTTALLNTQVGGVWNTADPAPKDWQGIWFHPGATGSLENTEIRYAGHDFRVNNFIYTGFISEAVRTERAQLSINNSRFMASGATNIYLYGSTTTITNTVFEGAGAANSGSDTAIESDDSQLTLDRDTFKGFSNPAGPIWAKFVWPNATNLVFIDNALNVLFLDRTATTEDTELDTDLPIITNNLIVSAGTTLTVHPGVTVLLPDYGAIQVKGELQAVGTVEQPITFTAAPGAETWDAVNFDHANGSIEYVVMNKGNRLGKGVISSHASKLAINRSSFMDNRPPSDIFNLVDTELVAKNSIIGYTLKPNFQHMAGIHAEGGALYLDQVTLKNLTVGIEGLSDPLPILKMNGMNEDYFPGVDLAWNPPVWVGSDGNTISVGDPNAGQTP